MNNLSSKIKEEIPEKPKILGFYDDEEEKWVKFPLGKEIIGIQQVNRFVKIIVKEVEKLKNLLQLKELDIVLEANIGGYRIDYKISLNEDIAKRNESIIDIVRKIETLNRVLKSEKVKAKFTKLILTFYES